MLKQKTSEIEELDYEIEIYRCFSKPLRNFLIDNNIKFLVFGKDSTTNNMFWVFIKDGKLIRYLSEWSKLHPEENIYNNNKTV